MARSVLVLTTVTALGFGGYCAHLFNALESERATTTELREQVAALETMIDRRSTAAKTPVAPPLAAARVVAAVPATPVKQVSSVSRHNSASDAADASSQVSREPLRAAMERQQALFKDPEYRAAMREQQKLSMRQMYPDLESATGLPAEQLDRLMELLAEQQVSGMENRASLQERGNPEQWMERMRQQQRESENALAAELGADGLQKWKDYQASLGSRYQVRNLRSQLDAAGVPLREDQVSSLVTALRSAEAPQNQAGMGFQAGVNNGVVNSGDRAQAMQQAAKFIEEQAQRQREAVRPYLSPQQFEQYEKIQEQQERMRQASTRMMQAQMDAMAKSQPGGSAPADAAAGSSVLMSSPRLFVPNAGVISSGFTTLLPLDPATAQKVDPAAEKKRQP